MKSYTTKINPVRISTLLSLASEDDTGSPLEQKLQKAYGENITRHGAYDLVLMYSKSLEAMTKWTEHTPQYIINDEISFLESLEEAIKIINEHY
jgi:hypothetical protein